MAEISVIVPVYKVENYLDRCVQSILNQTYQDFELILVDDGSPDNSGALCDGYTHQDSRVHVIHQGNAGAAAARNAGLDWAEGSDSQWILFVDSDDWAHPRMFETLVHAAQALGTDMSICGYGETEGEDPWEDAPIPEPELWQARDFYPARFIGATVPWGKLYRKEAFRGIRYPVGKYIDDEFVTYRLLFAAERLAVVSAPLYAYFFNREGLMKRAWHPKLLYAWEAFEEQIAFFTERGETEMVKFRLREYLENALASLEGAKASQAYQGEIPRIERRIRTLIPRAWNHGAMDFWVDYDLIARYYPLRAKIYRFWLDRLGGKKRG